jgi:hypothetical protein
MRLALAAFLGAVAVALVALGVLIASRRGRAEAKAREAGRLMAVHSPSKEAPFGAVDIDGQIVSPPTTEAPLSGTPCAVWEIALSAERETAEGERSFEPIWSAGRAGDVTLSYDSRMLDAPGPHVVPGSGGTVDVPGRSIRVVDRKLSAVMPLLALRGGPVGEARIDRRALERLVHAGLPADLAAQIHERPQLYRLREGIATTGDPLRLFQAPAAAPSGVPDPDQPFQVYPLSRDAFGRPGAAAGCLAWILIASGLVAAVCGLGVAVSG